MLNLKLLTDVAKIASFSLAIAFFGFAGSVVSAQDFSVPLNENANANAHPLWDLLRVRSIGYKLARANAFRCKSPTMQTGLILHDAGGFSEIDRQQGIRGNEITYGFGVLDYVEASPADRAGLRRGDEIVGINGRNLEGFAINAIGRRAAYDRVEAFESLMQTELQRGSVTLTVRKGYQYREVGLEAESGCGGSFAVLNSRKLNAWSNGKYVTVSAAMLRHVNNDEELAFVLAHEIAHNILGHNDRFGSSEGLLAGSRVKPRGGKRHELDADALGIRIVATAGFDPISSVRLFEHTKIDAFQGLTLTHPSVSRRILAVHREIERVATEQKILADADVQFGKKYNEIRNIGLQLEMVVARNYKVRLRDIEPKSLTLSLPPYRIASTLIVESQFKDIKRSLVYAKSPIWRFGDSISASFLSFSYVNQSETEKMTKA